MPEVYLHGFMAGPELWEPLHQRLTDTCGERERLALALPFHEHARARPQATSFAEGCTQLWQKIDGCTAPATPVHLVGYSLGARLALAMALGAPQRVASLVLIGVHPGLSTEADRAARRLSDSAWAAQLRSSALPDVMRAWDAQPLFAHRGGLSEDRRAALMRMRQHLTGEALACSLDVLGLAQMPDMAPRLPGLTVPVQVIAGTQDPKFMHLARQVVGSLPQATLWPIEGAGHDVVLTHPQALAEVCLAAFGRGSGRA